MADSGPADLQTNGKADRDGGVESDPRTIHVGRDLHVHPGDLRDLADLARTDPELARRVVAQRDRADAREHGSQRLGMVTAVAALSVVVAGVVAIILSGEVLTAALGVGLILAFAFLVRVITTGQWSETSWLGKVVSLAQRGLGGRPSDDGPGER